jgi:hypothetical protein
MVYWMSRKCVPALPRLAKFGTCPNRAPQNKHLPRLRYEQAIPGLRRQAAFDSLPVSPE